MSSSGGILIQPVPEDVPFAPVGIAAPLLAVDAVDLVVRICLVVEATVAEERFWKAGEDVQGFLHHVECRSFVCLLTVSLESAN